MRTHWHNLSFSLAGVMILPGCKSLPAIPLTTPQPLEVNLNMRLDVYQYRGDEPQDKEAVKTLAEATERQRNRMSEVQTIKDNRFIGEDHRGLLQLREVPAGDWGDYVKRTIDAENEDRMLLMRNQAKELNKALHEVQSDQWKLRLEKSYKGEWIEVPGDKPSTFKWVKAEGPKPKSAEITPAKVEPIAPATSAPKPEEKSAPISAPQ